MLKKVVIDIAWNDYRKILFNFRPTEVHDKCISIYQTTIGK